MLYIILFKALKHYYAPRERNSFVYILNEKKPMLGMS